MNENMFINRRDFLFGIGALSVTSGISGCGTFGGSDADMAQGVDIAPKTSFTGKLTGRRLTLASVGCGGMGASATQALIDAGCDLVAVCDINPKAFDKWEKKYPGIPKFTDYRDMLKTMGDKFEVVQVGTPDHTHAYISIDCMNAGKHVYVQKPLARTVEECELMLQAQIRNKVVVQMGNQGHPGVHLYGALRDAKAWGEIKELYSWSDRPIWPQGMKEYAKAQPLPEGYDPKAWDCWCGPSADHGYSNAYHAFKWRGWWDYGCGAIGDMAVHNADPAFWTFELGLPVKVKADTFGEGPVSIAYPKKSRIEMTFAPNKWVPNGIKMVWTDGGVKPDPEKIAGLAAFAQKAAERAEQKRAEKAKKDGKDYKAPAVIKPCVPGNGLIVVGTKATSIGESHASRPEFIVGAAEEIAAATKAMSKVKGYNHYREFVEAVQANDPAKCGSRLAYAAPLTEALLIGCIALRYPGEELCFDPKAMKFTNKPEANAFLKAPSRNDWVFKRG